ncbi:MAG: hypothetical protein COY81_03325 [Candidatus Pacebacteria bacterium CG_4_10_14_0_8_um_filter_43_12]|nr:MAG: hypothetical protein COU66_03125 [Candidatus Pacebacteria bacterium CG10_big_fil_rev_8_21_14_0_10_44_11]PIY79282.1 MAG: hypothetical protein COY81_03325 [Candidatus Pacebacteria bacterium CG_4_10_14_0_8_um_filter_43_12]
MVSTVGKMLSEVDCAYIAGLLDADGAIMAMIEKHHEKRFGYRVRVVVKITQTDPTVLHWIQNLFSQGRVVKNKSTYDWIVRDQSDSAAILSQLLPFLKVKKQQAYLAQKIIKLLQTRYSKNDFLNAAQLADTVAGLNVRSRNRRRNFLSQIQESISRND